MSRMDKMYRYKVVTTLKLTQHIVTIYGLGTAIERANRHVEGLIAESGGTIVKEGTVANYIGEVNLEQV